jgi:uncharacterized protein YjiK
MRKTMICLLFITILGTACSKDQYSTHIRFLYKWLDEPGFGSDIDPERRIIEPSGICFHPSRKTLFVVSDEGMLLEIKTDGTPVSSMKIPGDLEEVTVNPQTGFLYVIVEGEDVILEVNPAGQEVTRKFPINRQWQGNPDFIQKQRERYDQGVESLEFVPDEDHPEGGTFYAGNQWDPPCVFELNIPLNSSQEKTAEAKILRILPLKLDDPAAMFYDPKTGLLNVVSDADNILVEITLEGKIVKEYAFPGDNQEGITRDDKGFMYIAQDSGGILKVKDLR